MLLTKLSSILVASSTASACMPGFSHGIIAREIQAGNLNTKRQVSTTRLLDSNTTHWTPADNMRQMQRTDDAFNARDLGAAFNHHPNVTVYNPMSSVMNLAEHLQDLRLTFSTYSDAAPHNHDYRVVFAEGDWTVAATRAAGTNDGPLQGPTGEFLPPTDKPVAYSILTVAHWQDGLILEEYLWSDLPSAYRQLGLLPTRPPSNPPDIELNAYSAPLSTSPDLDSTQANKVALKESDDAFNAGNFTAESMRLSANVTVYGLNDEGLNLQGYLNEWDNLRTAFPDLRLENEPYTQIIAQGDWTATVTTLSGTHKGPLVLPAYLAEAPIQASGKKFKLLHYNIARWQDGEIIEMKVFVDTFGILTALGISF